MGEKDHGDEVRFECEAERCLCDKCDNDDCTRDDTCGWCHSQGLEDECMACGRFKLTEGK